MKTSHFLRQLVAKQGITQREFALRIGIEHKALRQYFLTGRLPISHKEIIANELHVSVTELESNGVKFIATRKGLPGSVHSDIMPIIQAVSGSGLKTISASEFFYLARFQKTVPSPLSSALVFELITNIRDSRDFALN